MAGCKKKHSTTQKHNFKQYALENRAVINRVKRLGALLKKETNETKINELKTAIQKAHFRRQKPKQSILTNDTKTRLKIVKYFTGKGYKNLISNNFIDHSAAWLKLNFSKKNGKIPANIAKLRIFSIGENLPNETLKQLEALKKNLQAA